MHTCMHMHIHVHVHVHTYAYAHMHMHTCMNAHAHAHAHIHAHAHTHAHICPPSDHSTPSLTPSSSLSLVSLPLCDLSHPAPMRSFSPTPYVILPRQRTLGGSAPSPLCASCAATQGACSTQCYPSSSTSLSRAPRRTQQAVSIIGL
jgi:hypothetical protein